MWNPIILCLSWYAVQRGCAQQIAAPLIFAPTKEWLGNDGPWSVFSLEIGTPPQRISVLPGSSATSVFSVIAEGCQIAFQNSTDCATFRGGLYAGNQSSTWEEIGIYQSSSDTNTIDFNALYGRDSVSLGAAGSGLPSVDHTLVAQIATTEVWLGLFGISPQPTNFSSFNEPEPTFFTMLRSEEWIASRTWSYTAGSVNRDSPASLIFGGFDASLLDSSHSVSVLFSGDAARQLSLNITRISTNITAESSTEMWTGQISAAIDSATAQVWLPLDACQAFEGKFGLIWDDASSLYFVNDSLHESLVATNPAVFFTVQGTRGSTTLSLSYNSFDLNVSWPHIGSGNYSNITQRYFPLKRASNEAQYTLGRAFLQEVYVIADYDRLELNVSQAVFSDVASRVYTITPPGNSSASNDASDTTVRKSMTGGAIAGIAVGIAAALVLAYICFAWAKKRWPFSKGDTPPLDAGDDHGKAELDGTTKPFAEAPDDQQVNEMSGAGKPHESNAQIEKFELPAGTEESSRRHELPAEVVVHELPAGHRGQ